MYYQLPNGKTIQLSIDQYLSMTDEDIQYLISVDYGDTIISPFYGSAIKGKKRKKTDEEESFDKSLDYTPEDEDKSHGDNIPSDEISLDDLPDLPDELPLD